MYSYPNVSLGAVGSSDAIVPYSTRGVQIGQLVAQPITGLGMICKVSAGASLTYTVQITGDDPNNIVNWIDHDFLRNLTASQYGQVIYPVSAIRLNVTVWASGTVNMGTVQWP